MAKIIKTYKVKGVLKKKEINDPNCLSKEDVLKIITEENWGEFEKWIFGKSGPVLSDGRCGYYFWDVEEFKSRYIDHDESLTPDEIYNMFQENELKKAEISNSLGKINTREWNSSRKGESIKENQHSRKKKPAFHSGLKRTKKRWNKKKGKLELSKKGSRDKTYWSD